VLTRPYLAVTLAEAAPSYPHPVTGGPFAAIAARLRSGARPDVAEKLESPVLECFSRTLSLALRGDCTIA
jgi:hypothetical protein